MQNAETKMESTADLETALFEFLIRKYMQRQDARQHAMDLVYMTAETHDLVKEVVRFLECRANEQKPKE